MRKVSVTKAIISATAAALVFAGCQTPPIGGDELSLPHASVIAQQEWIDFQYSWQKLRLLARMRKGELDQAESLLAFWVAVDLELLVKDFDRAAYGASKEEVCKMVRSVGMLPIATDKPQLNTSIESANRDLKALQGLCDSQIPR